MSQFKVGDRVKLIADNAIGKIKKIDSDDHLPYLIELDNGGSGWVFSCDIESAQPYLQQLEAKKLLGLK